MEITGLGYIGFNATNIEAWRRWGTEIIGFSLEDPTPAVSSLNTAAAKVEGALYFRMDERRQRMNIYPAKRDGLAYLGWELSGRIAFRKALEHLDAIGYPYEVASEQLALERGVQGMAFLFDPVGYRHEIFYSAYYMESSFRSPRFPMKAGFRTEHGIGHAVLIVPKLTRELDDFAVEVLGMNLFAGGLSIPNTTTNPNDDGRVRTEMYRGARNLLSHNLVYMEKADCFGIHHMLFDYNELDDLGRTYDLVRDKSEYPLIMELGRHQSDTNLSFYCQTPSKFLFELSWGSKVIPIGAIVQDRPLHSFAWGLKQVGPVLSDHLLIANQHDDDLPAAIAKSKIAKIK